MLVISVDAKKINRIEKKCTMFRNPHLEDGQELCESVRFVHVVTPGHPEHLFPQDNAATPQSEENTNDQENNEGNEHDGEESAGESEGTEFPAGYQHCSSRREDIDLFRQMGLDSDDDNDPVPENVPEEKLVNNNAPANDKSTDGLKSDQS